MSKDKIKSFSSGHIFNLIEFKGKLPRIPILVNEYKSIIKKEVFSLDYGKGIANTERENNKIKNSIFNNINHHKFYKKKNNVFKRKNFAKSATPKKIYSRNLQYKKRIKLPSDILNNNISNSKSEIFLTDIPNNNNSNNYEYINNRINNFKTIDLSNISLGKKKLPPIRNREFIKSLDDLILNADLNYENLQDKVDDVNKYEKKMIKKCNQYFKKLDDKITIKSDDFLKEKLVEQRKISMKFNDFFDKIISQKKEFDYVTMMNMLKNKERKNKLKEIINRQKSDKKHEKFYKIIEDSKIEIEKANRLIDSMIKN
jgi:hypothetical protein